MTDGEFLDPIYFMNAKELREHIKKMRSQQFNKEEFVEAEDGSEDRFESIFKKHLGWWLVHNLIAHVAIGIAPIKPFFDFHDWTSRKMRQ